MSEWTDIRDKALDSLKSTTLEVTEEAKQETLKWINEEGLPLIENLGNSIVEQTQKQAKEESGWRALRDGAVIPLGIRLLLIFMKKITTMTNKGFEEEASKSTAA